MVLCPPSRLQELTVEEGGEAKTLLSQPPKRSLGVTVGEVTMKPVGPQEKGKVGGSRVDGMPITSVHLSHHTGPSSG